MGGDIKASMADNTVEAQCAAKCTAVDAWNLVSGVPNVAEASLANAASAGATSG
jgi:hypothetical protein